MTCCATTLRLRLSRHIPPLHLSPSRQASHGPVQAMGCMHSVIMKSVRRYYSTFCFAVRASEPLEGFLTSHCMEGSTRFIGWTNSPSPWVHLSLSPYTALHCRVAANSRHFGMDSGMRGPAFQAPDYVYWVQSKLSHILVNSKTSFLSLSVCFESYLPLPFLPVIMS
jgi:hypothetical protein